MKLKWFLIGLVPIGLIAMAGCSPPKSAPVSQANNNPPRAVTETPSSAETGVTAGSNPAEPAVPVSNGATGDSSSAEPADPNAGSQPAPVGNSGAENNSRPEQGGNEPSLGEGESGSTGNNSPPKLPEFPGPTGKFGTGVGDKIPEIKGKDIDKKSFELADYSGRVVMVDFWGDW